MIDAILDWVRDFGVEAILRKKVIKGALDVILLDFIGLDGYWYSFRVFYTVEAIVSIEKPCIGGNAYQYLDSALPVCLLQFRDKAEWERGRYQAEDLERIVGVLNRIVGDVGAECEVGSFRLYSKKVYFSPCLLVVIQFSYKGARQKALVFPVGQLTLLDRTVYGDDVDDYEGFIDSLGLAGCVVWRDFDGFR